MSNPFIARCGLFLLLSTCAVVQGCSDDPRRPGLFFDQNGAQQKTDRLREIQAREAYHADSEVSRTPALQAQRDQLQQDVTKLKVDLAAIQQQLEDLQRTADPRRLALLRDRARHLIDQVDYVPDLDDPVLLAASQQKVNQLTNAVQDLKDQIQFLKENTR